MEKESGYPSTHSAEDLNRSRSWLLIKVNIKGDDLVNFAEELYNEWGNPNKQDDSFLKKLFSGDKHTPGDLVVIRIDIVHVENDADSFNMIVPVDAKNDDELRHFMAQISKLPQVIEIIDARVRHHFPEAPYLSNGYISIEEARLGLPVELPETVRLTRQSPGDNPWG